MFLFLNGHAAVLLLIALGQSLVFASFQKESEKNETEVMAKTIINFLKVPWMDRVDSFLHPSESACATEIVTLIDAIRTGKMWALQMFDASSKIPPGILRGNVRELGMYTECIGVDGQHNKTTIRGKHCMVSIDIGSKKFNSMITGATSIFSLSLCVPSSCDERQIGKIINTTLQLEFVKNKSLLRPITSETYCSGLESEEFTVGEISTIAFFATVGAFMMFCTICDFVKRMRPDYAHETVNELAKFSLYTNAISLLSTKSNPRTMPAIQGMRFLSMCWVVLGHRYVTSLLRPMINLADIQDWFNSWTAVYVQAAPFAVDTFFVISGFLMAYLFLKSKQSGKRSSFLTMYLHRYLRLTPALAVLTLFIVLLLHRVGNGFTRQIFMAKVVDPCKENWWVNLLYLQNFVHKEKQCLAHSWYLAVDMQLFWISPIILYPLHRWPKYGLGVLSSFIFASIITPAIILAVNGYWNAVIRVELDSVEVRNGFLEYYIPTYNRGCAYFIGVLLGYDVANKKRHLSQVNVAINWVGASILMLFCGWSTHHLYNSGYVYNVTLEFVCALSLRPSWSIAIAWIIYACTHGYGGFITRFLSLSLFLPLGRLSYCIYLVHMVIQVSKVITAQTPGNFLDFELFNEFWSDLVLSIAVAFVFSLFFESPVIVLEKMIGNRCSKIEKTIPVQETKKDLEMGFQNKAKAKD